MYYSIMFKIKLFCYLNITNVFNILIKIAKNISRKKIWTCIVFLYDKNIRYM